MTSRTRRTALAGLAAALLLTGCGDGPLRPGAAATVGDDRIPTDQLVGVVDRALSDEQAAQQFGQDRVGFQRQVLTRLISSKLLEEAARREGVEVTEGEVDARLQQFADQARGRDELVRQAAQSGIAEPDLRPFIRDLTLNDKVADTLVAGQQVPPQALRTLYQQNIAQYDQVRARHILVATQAEAQQVLTQVRADPASFAGLARDRSLDEGSGERGGELEPAGRGEYVAEFERALFSARPNVPGVVRTQFGFHVYELLERRTTTLQQATPALRRQALQDQREAGIGTLLQDVSRDLGVRVNPRFGRWDGEQGQVVEAGSSVSSPAPEEGGAGEPAPGTGQGLPEQGAPEQGTQDPGAPEQGTQDQGTQDQGTQEQGTQEQGTQDQGTQDPAEE